MKVIRILLVDDHALVRGGLKRLIESFEFPSFVTEASNGLEALEMIRQKEIDIVLLDIQMPKLNGIETMKRIKTLKKHPKVIIMTQFDEQALIHYMLQMGVNGFILKNNAVGELLHAIDQVMAEGYYFSPQVLKLISKSVATRPAVVNLDLSERENQLMGLLIQGESTKVIARDLALSVRTIESYRKALMKKTNTKNTADLIRLAFRTGIVEGSSILPTAKQAK